MTRLKIVLSVSVMLWCGSAAVAQKSYPMVMSLHPVAAQTGQTSEHEVTARYDMSGAYQIFITGQGVTGEVVQPHAQPEGPRQLPGYDAATTGENGEQEGEHLHQMRRIVAESLALVQGLIYQADLTLLEVAQPAVGQLR